MTQFLQLTSYTDYPGPFDAEQLGMSWVVMSADRQLVADCFTSRDLAETLAGALNAFAEAR